MNFYTFYTPSHKGLYRDFFLPYFPLKDFDLHALEFPQEERSGVYGTKGFNRTVVKKIELLVDACGNNMGKTIVYGDCDIQFFENSHLLKENVIKEISSLDMIFQQDGRPSSTHNLCSGFFAFRCNDLVLNFLNHVLARVPKYKEDQFVINSQIKKFPIKHGFFSDKFYTHARDNQWENWDGIRPLNIKTNLKDILVHHANWTLGVDNKIKLLNFIKNAREE